MKLIQIVENLDKGAVEGWLVNTFLESKKIRPEWEWTFYCILGKEGRLDATVKAAGGKIIYSPCTISNKFRFLSALRKTLKVGHYDIIHSHHDYLSGFYLLASRGISFRKRILHIHNTDESLPTGNRFLQRALLGPFKSLAIHYSDIIVGTSDHALQQFMKTKKLKHKKAETLYCGIDLDSYKEYVDINQLRTEWGMAPTARILLFCGRMNEYKNPVFVVEVLRELLELSEDYFAVFVGEGYLSEQVKEKAATYNIGEHVRLLGWRPDMPSIMKASDLLVFPRLLKHKEGLGLVVVEAQAAGLPMVLSYGIPAEAIEIPELAHFIELNNNSREWASLIHSTRRQISRPDALAIMERSKFALPIATKNLVSLYEK